MPDKPAPPTEAEADFTEGEIARRRDETARRMIATPPKPQAELKEKKRKRKRAKASA